MEFLQGIYLLEYLVFPHHFCFLALYNKILKSVIEKNFFGSYNMKGNFLIVF